jgi:hypothetical protein
MLLVCGLISGVLGCGTGSDAVAAGGSGTTATGSSGAGASSVAAGASSGGDSGSGAGNCIDGATQPPVAALITDFSDAVPDPANPGEFRFGGNVATHIQGGTTTFSNPASTKGSLSVSDGALSFSATLSAPTASGADQFPYNGFVLSIDGHACVDASAYSSVSFTLSGTLGDCILYFSFAYSDDLASAADPNRGLCSGTCYPAEFQIASASTSVSFTETPTVPGTPLATVDSAKLVGVQWQLAPFGATSCTANFTVDDVMFE